MHILVLSLKEAKKTAKYIRDNVINGEVAHDRDPAHP